MYLQRESGQFTETPFQPGDLIQIVYGKDCFTVTFFRGARVLLHEPKDPSGIPRLRMGVTYADALHEHARHYLLGLSQITRLRTKSLYGIVTVLDGEEIYEFTDGS